MTHSESPASAVRRRALAGMLTVVTAVAFEALAVATVMPVVARALHGLALFGWGFTAFLIASILGMVAAGTLSDRRGPTLPFLSGLALFAVGLVVAGWARSMPVFIGGRAIQGLGAGENTVALYVLIARVFEETQRPKVFSAISAAWVLPSIVGPAVAGVVADHVGWRWVFFGLVPFVGAGLALLVPALHSLPPADVEPAPPGVRGRGWAALATAGGVAGLEVSGQQLRWWSLGPACVGGILLVVGLRRLLPAGALRLARGLPSVIAFRALLAGAFFGAEAFVPLDLQTVHGLRPSLAGLPLTLGAIGWSIGSYYQGHRPVELPRYPLVRQGFGLVAVGVAGLVSVTFASVSAWFAVLCWCVAGAGMGIAMATVGVLVLELSPVASQGGNSAALQIADAVGSTLSIGAGGALLAAAHAAGWATGPTVRIVFAVAAAIAVIGWALGGRVRPA